MEDNRSDEECRRDMRKLLNTFYPGEERSFDPDNRHFATFQLYFHWVHDRKKFTSYFTEERELFIIKMLEEQLK